MGFNPVGEFSVAGGGIGPKNGCGWPLRALAGECVVLVAVGKGGTPPFLAARATGCVLAVGEDMSRMLSVLGSRNAGLSLEDRLRVAKSLIEMILDASYVLFASGKRAV